MYQVTEGVLDIKSSNTKIRSRISRLSRHWYGVVTMCSWLVLSLLSGLSLLGCQLLLKLHLVFFSGLIWHQVVIVDEARPLRELSTLVGDMARHEEQVPGLDHPGKPHEQHGVDGQSKGHLSTDEFWVLLQVTKSSQGQTPVGSRAPEMCACDPVSKFFSSNIVYTSLQNCCHFNCFI